MRACICVCQDADAQARWQQTRCTRYNVCELSMCIITTKHMSFDNSSAPRTAHTHTQHTHTFKYSFYISCISSYRNLHTNRHAHTHTNTLIPIHIQCIIHTCLFRSPCRMPCECRYSNARATPNAILYATETARACTMLEPCSHASLTDSNSSKSVRTPPVLWWWSEDAHWLSVRARVCDVRLCMARHGMPFARSLKWRNCVEKGIIRLKAIIKLKKSRERNNQVEKERPEKVKGVNEGNEMRKGEAWAINETLGRTNANGRQKRVRVVSINWETMKSRIGNMQNVWSTEKMENDILRTWWV